jgi:ribosome recycling factor
MTNLILNESNQKEFEKAMNEEMDKTVSHFERELITIRTGRAHPALVEDIKVEAYGGSSTMRLRDVASISTPEARQIVIQPWDKGVLGDVEKAIMNSDLGVTPINDGNIIRIQLPEMSAGRREELVKILNKKLEESRVAARNVRKDFNNLVRDSKAKKHISEDHATRLTDVLQKITDTYIKKLEGMAERKERDIKII